MTPATPLVEVMSVQPGSDMRTGRQLSGSAARDGSAMPATQASASQGMRLSVGMVRAPSQGEVAALRGKRAMASRSSSFMWLRMYCCRASRTG